MEKLNIKTNETLILSHQQRNLLTIIDLLCQLTGMTNKELILFFFQNKNLSQEEIGEKMFQRFKGNAK